MRGPGGVGGSQQVHRGGQGAASQLKQQFNTEHGAAVPLALDDPPQSMMANRPHQNTQGGATTSMSRRNQSKLSANFASGDVPKANQGQRKGAGFVGFSQVIPVTQNYSVGGNSRMKLGGNPGAPTNLANQTHINLSNFNKNAATTMSSGFQKQLAAIQQGKQISKA